MSVAIKLVPNIPQKTDVENTRFIVKWYSEEAISVIHTVCVINQKWFYSVNTDLLKRCTFYQNRSDKNPRIL